MQVLKACAEVGLECGSCTRHTASQLAQVSKGLPPRTLAQLFVQLYPNPECSPMHARFAAAYREASEEIPKRGVVSERFVDVRVAVA